MRAAVRQVKTAKRTFDAKVSALARSHRLFSRRELRSPVRIPASALVTRPAESGLAERVVARLLAARDRLRPRVPGILVSAPAEAARMLAPLRHGLRAYEVHTKQRMSRPARDPANEGGAVLKRPPSRGRTAPSTQIPEAFLDSFTSTSTGADGERDPFGLSGRNIEDTTFYNFEYYQVFAFEPFEQTSEEEPEPEPEPEPSEPVVAELPNASIFDIPDAEELLRGIDPQLDAAKLAVLDALLESYVAAGLDHYDNGDARVREVANPAQPTYRLPLPRSAYRQILEWDFVFNCLPSHYHLIVRPGVPGGVTLANGASIELDYEEFMEEAIAQIKSNVVADYWGMFAPQLPAVLRDVEVRETPFDPYSMKITVVLPRWVRGRSSETVPIWQALEAGLREDAPATPWTAPAQAEEHTEAPVAADLVESSAHAVEFGLRITYRQHWEHVGNQFGPPLRTIPLGPGQSEKISVKLTRREKLVSTQERSESKETLTESSSSTKDSNQVVDEAAKTNQWKIDQNMKGGFDCGLWNAGGSTQITLGEEFKTASKEAKESVSESVAKAATKIRNETKVTISREQEVTVESTQSSELRNANDEVAVTYLYQLLQKQYVVTTYLAEVAPVILVPQPLPESINFDFVRTHGRVIDSVLLDETYRDALAAIRSDPALLDETVDSPSYTTIKGAAGNAGTALSTISSSTATFGSTFDGVFSVFGAMAENHERQRQAHRRLKFLADQLFAHVATNILHYMRAIWSAEDKETRAMRLDGIEVSVGVHFVPTAVEDGQLESHWVIDPSGPTAKLSDLIDHTGPIAFRGNRAVYLLRETDAAAALAPLYAFHRLAFSRAAVVEDGPTNPRVRVAASFMALGGEYELELEANRVVAVYRVRANGTRLRLIEATYHPDQEVVTADGAFGITVASPEPAVGSRFSFRVWPQTLADPELLTIESTNPLPVPGSPAESDLFTKRVLKDMFFTMPGLRALVTESLALEGTEGWLTEGTAWEAVPAAAKALVRSYYHEYLLRLKNRRFVIVDTNSVVLNLFTGNESALETFKRAHRYLDVLRADVELERRKKLLALGDLGDPDVEKIVKIDGIPAGVLPSGVP
jgi:hypothetical protein